MVKNVSLMADRESKIIDLANKSFFAEYSIGITAVGKHHLGASPIFVKHEKVSYLYVSLVQLQPCGLLCFHT